MSHFSIVKIPKTGDEPVTATKASELGYRASMGTITDTKMTGIFAFDDSIEEDVMGSFLARKLLFS